MHTTLSTRRLAELKRPGSAARRPEQPAQGASSAVPVAPRESPAGADGAVARPLRARADPGKRSRRSSEAHDQLRDVLLAVLAEREPELPEHLLEVAALARTVAQGMGLRGKELEVVARAAELHDVGKIAVPEAILNKPAPLDLMERAIIESHCEAGERILSAASAMVPVARLVRATHERYDGHGYPDRLSGSEIPLGARIITVCDAYQAMINDRSYESRVSPRAALAELRRCAGTQFDPQLVEVFCRLVRERTSPERMRAATG
jgi:two-component system, cell cycle response regulator